MNTLEYNTTWLRNAHNLRVLDTIWQTVRKDMENAAADDKWKIQHVFNIRKAELT